MAKYIYPAVFTPEENGYFINFPDFESCYTQGKDLADGISMAEDVLALMLTHFEDERRAIPDVSQINDLVLENNSFATYVSCDTTTYRRLMNNAAVKKTLSIPSWLNDSATAAGLNFSQVLQDALKQQLNIVWLKKTTDVPELDGLIRDQEMYERIGSRFWEAAKVGGVTYGVPGEKEIGNCPMWVLPKLLCTIL